MEIAITKFFHLLAMSIWVGAGFTGPIDALRTLRLGKPHTDGLAARLRWIGRILAAAGTVTIATGLAFVFLKGGFKAVSPRIHAGILFSVLVFAVGGVGVAPVLRALGDAIAAGDDARVKTLGRRFLIAVWIEELLRLVVLGLMVTAGAPPA